MQKKKSFIERLLASQKATMLKLQRFKHMEKDCKLKINHRAKFSKEKEKEGYILYASSKMMIARRKMIHGILIVVTVITI